MIDTLFSRQPPELNFHEIPKHLERLISILSPYGLEEGLRKYKKLKSSADAVTREHVLSQGHPCYEVIDTYRKLNGNLGGLDAHQQFDFEKAAFCSIQLDIVLNQTQISENARKQLLTRLIDFESAHAAMVEVLIAYHYWRDDGEIKWIDSNSTDSEFHVKLHDFEFVTECKRFGSYTGKILTRPAFTYLSNFLAEQIFELKVAGNIKIELNLQLNRNEQLLRQIVHEIKKAIKEGKTKIDLPDNLGTVAIATRPASGLILPISDPVQFAREFDPGGLHAIFSTNKEARVSPIVLTCSPKKQNSIYPQLKKVLSKAKKQIGRTKPGLIFVHYEGLDVGDVDKLKVDPTFGKFNYSFLSTSPNIAAICYGSGPFSREQSRDGIYNEAVQFKNPQVKLPPDFSFINDGDQFDSKIITATSIPIKADPDFIRKIQRNLAKGAG